MWCTPQAEGFLASEFPKYGAKPDERTFRSFVSMLCRAGVNDARHTRAAVNRFDTALTLVRTMQDQGIQPSVDVRVHGPSLSLHALW